MLFWLGLDFLLIIIFLIASLFFKEYEKKQAAAFVVFLLTFISAFRYGIGADYFNYEYLFYGMDVDSLTKEMTFSIIIGALRGNGFSAQMMFFIYACLNSFFIWLGLKFYSKGDNQQLLAGVVLYGVMIELWFESMNVMRQWLAMAVFLWGSRFLLQQQYRKFILVLMLMIFIHFSSIIAVLAIPLREINYSKRIHFLCIFCFVGISMTIDLPSLMITILEKIIAFIGVGTQYLGYLSQIWIRETVVRQGGTGLGAMFYIIVCIFALTFSNKKIPVVNFTCNMITFSLVIRSLFWFSLPLLRLRCFFEMFLLVNLLLFTHSGGGKYRNLVVLFFLVAFAVMKWGAIYQLNIGEGINIDYQMNFSLLQ